MSETLPTTTNPTIKALIESDRPRYQEIIPTHINLDRFIKSAAIAVYENPKLQQCDPNSIRAAIYCGAELGLDFTKAKGHAYLVPFKDKNGTLKAVFMPGYRGKVDLVRRSGLINKIESHLIYQNDTFEVVYGSKSHLKHVPRIIGDRGTVIAGYAIAFFKDQSFQFEIMTLDELEKIRQRSKTPNDGPWITDRNEMYRKTLINRLYKMLPSSPDMDRAMELDEEAHTALQVPAPVAVNPTLPAIPTATIPAAIIPESTTPTEYAKPVSAPIANQETPTKKHRATKAEMEARRAAASGVPTKSKEEQTTLSLTEPKSEPKEEKIDDDDVLTPPIQAPEGVDLF